jgi:hypothetical protein
VKKHLQKHDKVIQKRFGSEIDVETLTGITRSTLQRDRFLGRERFPSYKVGKRILYNLAEVEAIILASRQQRGVLAAQ